MDASSPADIKGCVYVSAARAEDLLQSWTLWSGADKSLANGLWRQSRRGCQRCCVRARLGCRTRRCSSARGSSVLRWSSLLSWYQPCFWLRQMWWHRRSAQALIRQWPAEAEPVGGLSVPLGSVPHCRAALKAVLPIISINLKPKQA